MGQSMKTVQSNGTVLYKNEAGKLHRTDGPAYETVDGYKGWYINGEHLSEEHFMGITKALNAFAETDNALDLAKKELELAKKAWHASLLETKVYTARHQLAKAQVEYLENCAKFGITNPPAPIDWYGVKIDKNNI